MATHAYSYDGWVGTDAAVQAKRAADEHARIERGLAGSLPPGSLIANAPKQSEITRELERQEKTLAMLEETVAGLNHKLLPVLGLVPRDGKEDVGRAVPGTNTPLGSNIASNTERLAEISIRLRELASAIAL